MLSHYKYILFVQKGKYCPTVSIYTEQCPGHSRKLLFKRQCTNSSRYCNFSIWNLYLWHDFLFYLSYSLKLAWFPSLLKFIKVPTVWKYLLNHPVYLHTGSIFSHVVSVSTEIAKGRLIGNLIIFCNGLT